MRNLWWPWLLVCAVSAAAERRPTVKYPLPFSHGVHAKSFEKGGIPCATCHPVGLSVEVDGRQVAPSERVYSATSSCHGCHLDEIGKAPRDAPSTCMTCHSRRDQLLPLDHTIAWTTSHGRVARSRGASCRNCHWDSECVECHDNRGPVVPNPHIPGFIGIHGVEAAIDPYKCGTCHAAQTCATCHAEGVNPW